mmetsp:Transcript_38316/g.63612  ORF Transcript_38316/g.63612 Transcript_38316/m.63612 type:complete len:536 (-) Transcript_38316:72-1679(-)
MASPKDQPTPTLTPERPEDDDSEIANVAKAQKEELPWEDLKEILLLAISSLQSKVERYRTFTTHISNERDALTADLAKMKEDDADILSYLERELAKSQAEFRILDYKAMEIARQKDDMEAQFRVAMEAKNGQWEAQIHELNDKIETYESELADLLQFKQRKASLENELDTAHEQLEQVRKEHAVKLRDAERQAELERDKIINQMYLRIKQTKEHYEKMTDDQIDTITKRTILENEQISAELAYQCKQTKKVLTQNEQLQQDNVAYQRDVELLRQIELDMAKKNTMYQKTIQSLLQKISHLEEDHRDFKGSVQSERVNHITALEEYNKSLELKLNTLEKHLRDANDETEGLRSRVETYEKELARLMALQDEAENIIVTTWQRNGTNMNVTKSNIGSLLRAYASVNTPRTREEQLVPSPAEQQMHELQKDIDEDTILTHSHTGSSTDIKLPEVGVQTNKSFTPRHGTSSTRSSRLRATYTINTSSKNMAHPAAKIDGFVVRVNRAPGGGGKMVKADAISGGLLESNGQWWGSLRGNI